MKQMMTQEKEPGFTEITDSNPDWQAVKKHNDIRMFGPTPKLFSRKQYIRKSDVTS
ncbi:hypothetical protein DPMN_175295 [Dreissena polymorpha]|uniref:Uncharacterized protein n=1 Tax=Dreissena polymorpha TaxID=45954 RepID=A0A9D4E7W4_DREPO|nr:hypothetical protein DPMN_175295 [Dreissena polymorpha]